MKNAYIFPGQGSQYPGMAKDLYESGGKGKELLETANEILGFRITDIMFEGTPEDPRNTTGHIPALRRPGEVHRWFHSGYGGRAFSW